MVKDKAPKTDSKYIFWHQGFNPLLIELQKSCTIDTIHHGFYDGLFKVIREKYDFNINVDEVMTASKLR